MKNWLLLLVFILSGTLLSQENQGAYEIYGEIEGVDRGKISLVILNLNGDSPKKARIKDGKFHFKGEINHTIRVAFWFNDIPSTPFFLDNSTISLQLKILDKEEYNKDRKEKGKLPYRPIYLVENIQGSDVQDAYINYLQFVAEHNEKSDYQRLLFNYFQEKIESSPDNYLYFELLYRLARSNKTLTPNQILKLTEGMNLSYIDIETKKKFVEVIQRNRS